MNFNSYCFCGRPCAWDRNREGSSVTGIRTKVPSKIHGYKLNGQISIPVS